MNDLCRATGTNAVSVKRAAMYWVFHGVLKEISPDTFEVLEHAETTSSYPSMSQGSELTYSN